MKIKYIFTLAVCFFLAACVITTKNRFGQRGYASSGKKTLPQNRLLEMGQPTFVQNKNKDLSIQKHIQRQWALKDISILKALEVLDKNKNHCNSTTAIKPCIVAVVDTGIHPSHPCLKNNLWTNKGEIPGNNKDDDGNGFIDDIHGWNFVDNNNNIQDNHGHGTHISGIIAASGETPQSPNCKVRGVAPHVQIMTLKYFSEGNDNENIENTVKAIKYAVDHGADIINYSGGGPGENLKEKSAIAKAADKNIIFVAALGNEGSQIGESGFNKKPQYYYPASYELPNIISVQAKNKDSIITSSNRIKIESYEDRDKKVQTAPGYEVISTLPPRKYLQSYKEEANSRHIASSMDWNNSYGRMTGTSQSTAFATGVAALVKTNHPSWNMELVINQVIRTGFGQGTDKIKKTTNQGKKLDAYKALTMRDQNVNTLVDEPISNPNELEKDTLFESLKNITNIFKKKGKEK